MTDLGPPSIWYTASREEFHMTERQLDGDWKRVRQMLDRLSALVSATMEELTKENAQLRAENAELKKRLAAYEQQDRAEM